MFLDGPPVRRGMWHGVSPAPRPSGQHWLVSPQPVPCRVPHDAPRSVLQHAPALLARWTVALGLAALTLVRTAEAQAPWWAPRYGEPLEATTVAERTRAAEHLGRETVRSRVTAANARLVLALPAERHPVVRDAIIVALGRLAHPDALEALVSELATSRSREAQRLLWAIAAVAEAGSARASSVLVDQLATRGRTEYAREALQRAGVAALPALLRALRDATDGRTEIARAIGALRSHQATPSLLRALDGEWQSVEGVALLEAIASVADPRARGGALRALARSDDLRVQRAALHALSTLGVGAGAEAIEPLLDSEDGALASQALETLLQIDPPRGAEALTASVAASDPTRVQQAAELALAWRHPRVVPVLFGLVNEGTRAERALSALAELDDGAGVGVLLHVARESPQHASAARTGLSLALRRYAAALPRGQRRDALDEIAREPGDRAALLRALARDASVIPDLRQALGDAAPITRLRAAHALMALGDAGEGLGPPLFEAARRETSDAVFQELVYAYVHTRSSCPQQIAGVRDRLRAASTRDAALLLLSGCGAELPASLGREVAHEARRQLRSRSTWSRATAAWSLSRLGDPQATRTLLSHLEAESDPWVRRALARAVWVLAEPEHAAHARNASRMETDARAAAWLREAGRGPRGGRRFESHGEEVLRVQLRPVDPVPEGLTVDVRLDDGRALRITTYSDALLLLPDLAAGVADVEVAPTPALAPR